MMPTTRAAILAVGLACAALTAHPNNITAAAQAAPHTYVDAPALDIDGLSLLAELALSIASVGTLALYLRRRARRPDRRTDAAASDLIAPATAGVPGRRDHDRGDAR